MWYIYVGVHSSSFNHFIQEGPSQKSASNITCFNLDRMKVNFLTKRNKLQKYSKPIITSFDNKPTPLRPTDNNQPAEVYFSFRSTLSHFRLHQSLSSRVFPTTVHRSLLLSDLFRLISYLGSAGSQSTFLWNSLFPS